MQKPVYKQMFGWARTKAETHEERAGHDFVMHESTAEKNPMKK
jgi:hypothetical protein